MTTRNALLQLPKKPSDEPQAEIYFLLHQFTTDVARHVEGIPTCSVVPFSSLSSGDNAKGLIQSMNTAQESFRISIRITAPNFRPFERKDADRRHLGAAPFLKHEEGDKFEDCESDEDEHCMGDEDGHCMGDEDGGGMGD